MIRYGSLFAGAGLLDHGLHRSIPSLRCEFAVESNAKRLAIFGAHFPAAQLLGEIESIDPAQLPDVDGLIGGVPCNTHSTSNTAGARGLAEEWTHARDIAAALDPSWTVWESSSKDRSWLRWVPFVRADLSAIGHTSVCVPLRTRHRVAPHDRQRAIVFSWRSTFDTDTQGQSARAVHGAVASLREAPVDLWDGRIPPRAHGRLDDGIDRELAVAIGYGVDQRTAADIARILGALIRSIVKGSARPPRG